jgi:hypothetical protein
MPTNLSLLGTHGIDLDVARQYGNRFEAMTCHEKTCFMATICGWLAHCASSDELQWGSFAEYVEEGYGDLDPSALPMIQEHFDYCDPVAIFPLLLALTHQCQEGVYAPDPAEEDDGFLYEGQCLVNEGQALLHRTGGYA